MVQPPTPSLCFVCLFFAKFRIPLYEIDEMKGGRIERAWILYIALAEQFIYEHGPNFENDNLNIILVGNRLKGFA